MTRLEERIRRLERTQTNMYLWILIVTFVLSSVTGCVARWTFTENGPKQPSDIAVEEATGYEGGV